jgi:hypothetical protein
MEHRGEVRNVYEEAEDCKDRHDVYGWAVGRVWPFDFKEQTSKGKVEAQDGCQHRDREEWV